MKKFKASIAKWTDDNLKTNAFYDIGMRTMFTVIILVMVFEKIVFPRIFPIPVLMIILYLIPLLCALLLLIIFFILMTINLVKRTKNKSLDLSKKSKYWLPSLLLNTVGMLIFLPNIFLSTKIHVLSFIALVLIPTSIIFYILSYKEMLRAIDTI